MDHRNSIRDRIELLMRNKEKLQDTEDNQQAPTRPRLNAAPRGSVYDKVKIFEGQFEKCK